MKHRDDLMKENLRLRLEIEQQFIDAAYWNTNTRKPDEPKINPDPEGQLAGHWLMLHYAAIEMSNQIFPAMQNHFERYCKSTDDKKEFIKLND